jgi:RNA polymerase sigma factor (sigma-70 family)
MSNGSLLIGWRQQWNRSLFQFLRRRVRAAVDVEDLAQETYLRLLRASDLSDVRNPHAYLLRVATHVALEWRERQPPTQSVVDLEDDMLVDEDLPELVLDARLSQKRLEQTLAGMSPMMRSVLLLKLRDERSYQQIAEDLHITVRQVRRYLARGYDRLRAAMEGE